MLNSKFKIQNSNNGFTVVELIVSMALFVVLAALASGTFIQTLRTQRMITSLAAANDNATQTLERITREIRTGFIFSVPSEGILKFINYEGDAVTYKMISDSSGSGSVGKCVGDTGCDEDKNFKLITPPEVKIKNLKFRLKGDVNDGFAPRVTIVLEVASVNDMKTNLQTTVSARTLTGN
jgi:prepilin-type N-terminal cleavage/methylation domain-containing protein